MLTKEELEIAITILKEKNPRVGMGIKTDKVDGMEIRTLLTSLEPQSLVLGDGIEYMNNAYVISTPSGDKSLAVGKIRGGETLKIVSRPGIALVENGMDPIIPENAKNEYEQTAPKKPVVEAESSILNRIRENKKNKKDATVGTYIASKFTAAWMLVIKSNVKSMERKTKEQIEKYKKQREIFVEEMLKSSELERPRTDAELIADRKEAIKEAQKEESSITREDGRHLFSADKKMRKSAEKVQKLDAKTKIWKERKEELLKTRIEKGHVVKKQKTVSGR